MEKLNAYSGQPGVATQLFSFAVPWVALIVGLGLWRVEAELEEQALLNGSPATVFFRVTLPAVWPAIGVAAIWVLVTTTGEMTVTDLFIVRTYAEELYTRRAASYCVSSTRAGGRGR